jgi:tetratricopeptide (TPR) repeat protein
MDTLTPHWRVFLRNLAWYIATLIVLMILTRFLRHFFVFVALWSVGLLWGGILAYQFSQLLFGADDLQVNEEQLQGYLSQALAYKAQIDTAIKGSAGQTERFHQERLIQQIETWTAAISNLVQRLSSLRQDGLIRRDLQQVPKAIADLEKRLASTSDPGLHSQLERTLANRQKQLASLRELQSTMERAEVQIESTLSLLGTIYSQILTGQSTSHVANYDRLSEDVDEEVRLLQDHLEALREVKLGGE